ncbi:MAG: transglutaminase domain-containing protein, partial [Candidatus Dormibacteraeota bacterium]|nr:transglutaminase domain-containing protein [Candidatus Dormibacteraeota bacterium]
MATVRARASLGIAVPSQFAVGAICAALAASVAWAVLAAGWVQGGGGGAIVVAVAATVEAALLAQARVPRLVIVLIAPVLALAAIVPTTLGTMPFDGNASAGHAAGRYVAAIFGGLGSNSDWAFIVGLCAILWICGYWLGWLALRERRGVLAVLPMYAVLATNVLNAHAPDTVALPEGIAVMLSLVVIAGSHLDALQARWVQHHIPSLPGTRGRFAATIVVAAAVLTGVALLLPPVSTADISSRFFPGPGPGGRSAGALGGAGLVEFATGTVPGGSLVSQPQPVLTYTVDTPAPVYLRIVDDTQFIAGNWYPNPGADTNSPNVITFGGLRFTGGVLPRDTSVADGGIGAATVTVHADIIVQPGATGSTGYVPFAGDPISEDQPGVAFGAIDASHPHSLLTVDSVQLDSTPSQVIELHPTSLISTASADQLRSAGTHYPLFVQQYTNLEDDNTGGGAAIARLAALWTAGTSDPYDAAVAIETHLRNPKEFQYTLTPPTGPGDEWPVVYFLTTSHQGYCQYFASAMGAMLRSLNIPTRLVSGYGPGTTEAQNGRQGRSQLVTTSDAHTWVESYFPRYGWIPFEPTPPSSVGTYQPFPRGAAAGQAPTPPAQPSASSAGAEKPGFGNGPSDSSGLPSQPVSRGPSPWAVFGFVAAGAVVLALAVLLWMLLPLSLRGAWRRLEVYGAIRGLSRGAGETHREYTGRVGGATPRAAPMLAELAVIEARAEFASTAADSASRRQAIQLWRRILRGAPRDLWSARRGPAP